MDIFLFAYTVLLFVNSFDMFADGFFPFLPYFSNTVLGVTLISARCSLFWKQLAGIIAQKLFPLIKIKCMNLYYLTNIYGINLLLLTRLISWIPPRHHKPPLSFIIFCSKFICNIDTYAFPCSLSLNCWLICSLYNIFNLGWDRKYKGKVLWAELFKSVNISRKPLALAPRKNMPMNSKSVSCSSSTIWRIKKIPTSLPHSRKNCQAYSKN